MTLQELSTKKVLILGFGREGKDTLLFLRKKFPKKVIGVADRLLFKELPATGQKLLLPHSYGRRKVVICHLGEHSYLKSLKKYEVIIKSPGIPPHVIAPYLTKKQQVTSQTEIFFEDCPGTIIGVTGTKGKSTTTSLIHAVLKHGGVRSRLIGNIGEPVLSYLKGARPNDVFVYELSSFQLENLRQSPHIAVLLNIYPEHLDHHGSFAKYVWAKANITRHQTAEDFLIYNAKDPLVANIAKGSKAQKIPFVAKGCQTPLNVGVSDTPTWIASSEPARLVGKLFGIPQKKIQQAIQTFKPLEHRLERVGEWERITFYNDSLATIPEATVAAINALGARVHTLIAGGFDRGLSMKILGENIAKSKVQNLILFPTTGLKILSAIKRPPQSFFAKNMREAVQLAYQHTPKGKICLLSPAASSFNMFKDYKDRGEQFKKWVRKYGQK